MTQRRWKVVISVHDFLGSVENGGRKRRIIEDAGEDRESENSEARGYVKELGAACAADETSITVVFRNLVAARESIRVPQNWQTFTPEIDGKN